MTELARVKVGEAVSMGSSLRGVRLEQGLTQAEVAKRMGLSGQGYASYEQGRTRLLATDLAKLARSLGVDLGVLVGRLGLGAEPGRAAVTPVAMGAFVFLPVFEHVHGVWMPCDEGIVVEASITKGRDLLPLRVVGDGLEPELRDGDVAVIDRANHRPAVGDLVVAVVGGELQARRSVLCEHGHQAFSDNGGVVCARKAEVLGVVELLQRRVRR